MHKTEKDKITRRKRKNSWMPRQITVFSVTLLLVSVLGLIMPLRPAYSEIEKRELTEFPQFSFKSLIDGSYFDGISAWYGDTFPFRELWVSADNIRQSCFGVSSSKIHGEITQSDEIPDAPSVPSENSSIASSEASSAASSDPVSDNSSDKSSSENTSSENPSSSQSSGDTDAVPNNQPTDPPSEQDELNKTQNFGAVLQIGDSAFEYYNFNKKEADRYASSVTRAGNLLSGVSNVWAVIPPTGMGIMLPDDMRGKINSSDQAKASEYMLGSIGGGVTGVPVYNTLMSRRGEYIYFRTDHHWTALGAYYAYSELMSAMGKIPSPSDSFEVKEFPGFLGSFYADAGKPAVMQRNPDTVTAYIPHGDISMSYTDKSGAVHSSPIIKDVSNSSANSKYLCFISGDNPYTVIQNNSLNDGSSCVVIKESYGNAFVPFLAEHYQTVHVIDYRYYSGTLADFTASNPVQDVIFVNNISATRSKALMEKLEKFVG